MSDPLAPHREELQRLAQEAATLPERRHDAIVRARRAGMPLIEAAAILGMSPQGLRKSARLRAARAEKKTQ